MFAWESLVAYLISLFDLYVDSYTLIIPGICGGYKHTADLFCTQCVETIRCLWFLYGIFPLFRISDYCLV